jgi:hypothetical protein
MLRLLRPISLIAAVVAVLTAGLVGARLATADVETMRQTRPDWALGWQVSAPRPGLDVTRAGAPVELGLRQRYAKPADRIEARVIVTAPDNQTAAAELALVGDAWTFLIYPSDFAGGTATIPGQYTVTYQVAGAIVATDGFTVDD